MKQLLYIASARPVYLLLLPVFFLVHAYVRFAGLLDTKEVIMGFLKISAGILLFFICLKLIWKDAGKAAVTTVLCGIVCLFFGDIKYTLSQLPMLRTVAHYKTFIPLLLILFVLFVYKVHRSKQLTRTTLFLNLLFLLYIVIDAISWLSPGGKKTGIFRTELKPAGQTSGKRPNIYYILLDCYPSPGYQQEMLGIANHYLDSNLSSKGFYVVKDARSNYSNTAFSMASTLGLHYLTNLDTVNRMDAYHYNRSMAIVKKSPFIKMIRSSGYSIYNLSIFDMADQPAIRKDYFLSASGTQLLFYNTMWSCFKRDLLWQINQVNKKLAAEKKIKESKKFFAPQKVYNLRLLDSLSKFQPVDNDNQPFFLYAHLKMPHFPYFFDENGDPYPDEAIYTDSLITDKKKFTGYIRYTDQKARELIDTILKRSGGNDIIILQSDHSIADMDWSRKNDAFRNYSAFYFPDKDYRQLYAGMSNVNTFRVILNKYFGQQLPLLPDKSFYTR